MRRPTIEPPHGILDLPLPQHDHIGAAFQPHVLLVFALYRAKDRTHDGSDEGVRALVPDTSAHTRLPPMVAEDEAGEDLRECFAGSRPGVVRGEHPREPLVAEPLVEVVRPVLVPSEWLLVPEPPPPNIG